MELDKAIEILELRLQSPFLKANPDTKDAIQLGMKALKRLQVLRANNRALPRLMLPGETPPQPLHALAFNTGDDESP